MSSSEPRASIPSLVREGIDAYAARDHFDAHERFEHAWLLSGAPRSLELHALAQLAAAMHKHVAQRKPDAARAIMRRARAKLEHVATSAHGVDLDRLRADIDAWLGGAQDEPAIHTR